MKKKSIYIILVAMVIIVAILLISQNTAIITETFAISPQAFTPPKNPGPATISFDKMFYKPEDTMIVTVTATANSYGTGQISAFKMMFVINPSYPLYSSTQRQTANAVKLKDSVYNAKFSFKIPVYTFNQYNALFIIVKAYAVDSQGRSGLMTSRTIMQTGQTILKIL